MVFVSYGLRRPVKTVKKKKGKANTFKKGEVAVCRILIKANTANKHTDPVQLATEHLETDHFHATTRRI